MTRGTCSGDDCHAAGEIAVFSALLDGSAGEHCGTRAIVAVSASGAAIGVTIERRMIDPLTLPNLRWHAAP